MGVNGLWKILKKTSKPIDLSSLNNTILAIDTSIWLVRFIKSSSGRVKDRKSFLKLVWMRICTLLYYGIRPIFVFDGIVPEIKKKTTSKRKMKINRSSKKYQQKLEQVILSQYGLSSLAQLKSFISNKENMKNFVYDNAVDEEHLLCDDIDSESEDDEIYNDIFQQIDSDEFFNLDEENKLQTLHKAKKHQKKISKGIIEEISSDYSPDQYSKIQMENFLTSSNLAKRIDETTSNIEQTKMKQLLSSPTSRFMFQRVEKHEEDDVLEETITKIRKRNIFASYDDSNQNSNDDISAFNFLNESFNNSFNDDANTTNSFDDKSPVINDLSTSHVKNHFEEKNEHLGKDEGLEDAEFEDVDFEDEEFSHSNSMNNCIDIEEDIELNDITHNDSEYDDQSIELHIPTHISSITENELDNSFKMNQEVITSDNKKEFIDIPDQNSMYDDAFIERIENLEKELQANVFNSEFELNSLAKQSAQVDDDYIEDFKTVLKLFGIPYIISSGEADAQCAYLEMTGVVDGIISDDSDIFLFGGKTLIKNAFSRRSNPTLYWSESIEKNYKFNRSDFVFLALLLGSDYTDGIKGIGPLSAVDIVSQFIGKDGVDRFVQWLNGKDDILINDPGFEKKYSKWKSKLFLFKGWPNRLVLDSYLNPPVVNVDIEWKEFDLKGLKELGKFIGWSDEHIDSQINPILIKYKLMLQQNPEKGKALDRIKKELSDDVKFYTPKRKNYSKKITIPSKKIKSV